VVFFSAFGVPKTSILLAADIKILFFALVLIFVSWTTAVRSLLIAVCTNSLRQGSWAVLPAQRKIGLIIIVTDLTLRIAPGTYLFVSIIASAGGGGQANVSFVGILPASGASNEQGSNQEQDHSCGYFH
jgi:hypothetical protein